MIKQYKLNSQRIIRLNPPKEFPVIGIKITEEAYVEDFVKKGIPNDLYNTLPDLYKGLCVRKREGMNRRQLMQE